MAQPWYQGSMDCLFCKIVAGEIPSREIYADDLTYAFLDINPWKKGHSLIVPRKHVADLLADPNVLTEISPSVTKVAQRLLDRLNADGLNMLVNSGEVAGQEVFHLHIHLIPRYKDDPGMDNLIKRGKQYDLDSIWEILK